MVIGSKGLALGMLLWIAYVGCWIGSNVSAANDGFARGDLLDRSREAVSLLVRHS
jgi:hypothetical protein